MKVKKTGKNYVEAHSSEEIAKALGIDSPADAALMEYKARLSTLAAKAIADSEMTVGEIVKRSGIARSKVSAIKNGALVGISSDLFLKVIVASGGRVTFKLTA